jgi:signal transduction histidine kinase
MVVAAAFVPTGRDAYLAVLALAAAPFATAGLAFTWRAMHDGPPAYRSFWRWWFAAAVTAYAAGTAALAAVVLGVDALLVLALALLVAAVPMWCTSSVRMLRAQAGRRAVSVDLLGALVALAVLGAPAVLLFAEPLAAADHPAFVVPFVASVFFVPAGLYLSVVNLSRVPRGERATQGIGMALGAAFTLNATVQIAQAQSSFTLPLAVVVAFQVANMGLLMAVPLWAHRSPTALLPELLPEQQVRRSDPAALLAAVLVPVLAVSAWSARDEQPWGVAYVMGVVAVVVVLSAIRHVALARETARLHAEVELVAAERRRLLAAMVRALEDDRQRMATELHRAAVESFAAFGALVQTAHATLPAESARAVEDAIGAVRDDLRDRAETLRALIFAVGAPEGGPRPTVDEGGLASALRALAAQLVDRSSEPTITISVDPDLEPDWSTTTMVHRITQEAMVNAVRHAHATEIVVEVVERDGAVLVEVRDDGIGVDPRATPEGSGFAGMRLFATLAAGELEVEPGPGGGTVIRAVLGGHGVRPSVGTAAAATRPPRAGRHLLLVATDPTGSGS